MATHNTQYMPYASILQRTESVLLRIKWSHRKAIRERRMAQNSCSTTCPTCFSHPLPVILKCMFANPKPTTAWEKYWLSLHLVLYPSTIWQTVWEKKSIHPHLPSPVFLLYTCTKSHYPIRPKPSSTVYCVRIVHLRYPKSCHTEDSRTIPFGETANSNRYGRNHYISSPSRTKQTEQRWNSEDCPTRLLSVARCTSNPCHAIRG